MVSKMVAPKMASASGKVRMTGHRAKPDFPKTTADASSREDTCSGMVSTRATITGIRISKEHFSVFAPPQGYGLPSPPSSHETKTKLQL
jgi:hypothetical protein